jgi:acid stress chaperone HdeB
MGAAIWTPPESQNIFLTPKRLAMKYFATPIIAGVLLCCSGAFAEDIDLSTWTCKQFLAASKEDVGVILAWLDGYYKEEDEPPVIDTEALVVKAKNLGQYCAAHPDSQLIAATDKLFQRE